MTGHPHHRRAVRKLREAAEALDLAGRTDGDFRGRAFRRLAAALAVTTEDDAATLEGLMQPTQAEHFRFMRKHAG